MGKDKKPGVAAKAAGKVSGLFEKLLSAGKYPVYIVLGVIAAGVLGFLLRNVIGGFGAMTSGEGFSLQLGYLIQWQTWAIGAAIVLVFVVITQIGSGFKAFTGDGNFFSSKKADVFSVLENSRFMTDKERDKYFKPRVFEELDGLKKFKDDGVPVRALVDKNGKLQINFLNGVHSLVIGSTGSGKTTTFINPMIQILGSTSCGSSMIMTDPKGELFDLHSKYLKERGYDVMVLDLRDTYSSSRWNPLDSIWDMYQEYQALVQRRVDQGGVRQLVRSANHAASVPGSEPCPFRPQELLCCCIYRRPYIREQCHPEASGESPGCRADILQHHLRQGPRRDGQAR